MGAWALVVVRRKADSFAALRNGNAKEEWKCKGRMEMQRANGNAKALRNGDGEGRMTAGHSITLGGVRRVKRRGESLAGVAPYFPNLRRPGSVAGSQPIATSESSEACELSPRSPNSPYRFIRLQELSYVVYPQSVARVLCESRYRASSTAFVRSLLLGRSLFR